MYTSSISQGYSIFLNPSERVLNLFGVRNFIILFDSEL